MKKLLAIISLFISLLCLVGCRNEAASIGIIGGADGPTAILVTSNVSWQSICAFIGTVVVAILVVLIIYSKKKK